jgi:hypothetical protein
LAPLVRARPTGEAKTTMRGRSCFVWGSVLYVVTGAIHALTHLQPPPTDPAMVAAHEAMAKATLSMGLTTNVLAAMDCLGWYMTTLSVLVGLVALSLAGRCSDDAWLLRRLSALLALGAIALAGIAFHFHVLPPAVLYSVTALLFVAAGARAQRPTPVPAPAA